MPNDGKLRLTEKDHGLRDQLSGLELRIYDFSDPEENYAAGLDSYSLEGGVRTFMLELDSLLALRDFLNDRLGVGR